MSERFVICEDFLVVMDGNGYLSANLAEYRELGKGFILKLLSYDDKEEHAVMRQLDGKLVRVVLEEINSEPR